MKRYLLLAATFATLSAAHCSFAAVKEPTTRHQEWKVMKGSSILKEYEPKNQEECDSMVEQAYKKEGLTRESGAATYQCIHRTYRMPVFIPNPKVTCSSPKPPESRVAACPAGTVGTYTQTLSYTKGPAPACEDIAGAWTPATPPVGMCAEENSKVVTVAWKAPTTNDDGTALTDLAGYDIVYGQKPTELVHTIRVSAATTKHVMEVDKGTWYFAVKAFNKSGAQSSLSNVYQKVVN